MIKLKEIWGKELWIIVPKLPQKPQSEMGLWSFF